MAGVEPLELPSDRPRPGQPSYAGGREKFVVDGEVMKGLRKRVRQEGATLYMALLAGFAVVLGRWSGQEEVVVGSPIANRNRKETEELIGFFANTMVLRTELGGEIHFVELLRRVKEVCLGAYAHQDVPFEKLVEELQPERDLSRSPLFQVGLVLQNAPMERLRLEELTISEVQLQQTAAKYDLTISLSEVDEGLLGEVVYARDLYDGETVQRLVRHYQRILEQASRGGEEKIWEMELLDEKEREQVLVEWNRTEVEVREDENVQELFEAQVERSPEAIAVEYEGEKLSYRELNRRANGIAERLRELGVGAEVRVGILMERSLEMVAGLMGVLKAGGAYVPLDPVYPVERLRYMAEDAGIRVLLVQAGFEQRAAQLFAGLPVQVEAVTSNMYLPSSGSGNRAAKVNPENAAYLIYTSGSTGKPKGVIVEHRGVCNLAEAVGPYGVGLGDRVLLFAPLSFDASVADWVMALLKGATLVMPPANEHLVGSVLSDLLLKARITHVTAPPSVLGTLEPCTGLPTLIVAGEACPPDLARKWSAGRTMLNGYGPTEMTVCASISSPLSGDVVTIGRPVANTKAYVLDRKMQPAPIGIPGELYLSGAGMARGYLKRPDRTAESFVPHPYATSPGERLYRTGDRIKWRADGTMEYLGRVDQQIKIHGRRIEPGEIEATLAEHAEVREAAVIGQETTPGDKRLVGYVIREPRGAAHIELWPSVAEYFVYDDLLYGAMLADTRRNDAYRAAFADHVCGKVVVEVGTGPHAVLARMCIEAGARIVYAIERLEESCRRARALVHELGLDGRIVVIQGDAQRTELPEAADVCVSEIVGPIGGVEGGAVILNDVRRFLKPSGIMIPQRSCTRVAAVNLPREIRDNLGFSETSVHYVRKIFEQVAKKFDLRVCFKRFPRSAVLSNSDIFEELDFRGPVSPEYDRAISLTIEKEGELDGVLVWLTLETSAGHWIDILEHDHCWLPVYFPVFESPVSVKPCDRVEATCSARLCENGVNPDYMLEGRVLRSSGGDVSFSFRSNHFGKGFRESSFYSALFSEEGEPAINAAQDDAGFSAGLLEFARERLPAYMVPSQLVVLKDLPLMSNGKLDRKALPQPSGDNFSAADFVPPRTPMEELVAKVWSEVLGTRAVSSTANFFHLGGHSLLATRVVVRLREITGTEIELRSLFSHPRLRDFAGIMEEAQQRRHNDHMLRLLDLVEQMDSDDVKALLRPSH
ncbi:MAG: amino acid adenylation domain-containing protein [Acidobacteriia bacterium]|nr:amino acid adenylation domain-containing protein [Terriglobia bacterium]